MYAKLEAKNKIQLAPKVLHISISNPTEEQLKFAGYKEVIEGEMPEAPIGYSVVSKYVDEGEYIRKYYEFVKIEEALEEGI